jgi:uncharacterized protein (TIGR00369 family)
MTTIRNPSFASDIAASFARQGALSLIGAELEEIAPGKCTVRLPITKKVRQHHGFVHGGFVATIADVAGGYAAMSLFDSEKEVLTVEYKINFLAPADGVALIARAHVVRNGRTLTVTQAEVAAEQEDGSERPCALVQQTSMAG